MKAYWTIKDGKEVYAIQGCDVPGMPKVPWYVHFTQQSLIGLVEGEEVVLSLASSPASQLASVKALVGGNAKYITHLARTMQAALAARQED